MPENLGQRIRQKRLERKLGLRETAVKVGISSTYLSRIETMDEASPPAEDVIQRLADLLGDDFDELMQLAGRVPQDVASVIKTDPRMPEFLRRVHQERMTGDELIRMLEERKRKGEGR